MQHEARAKLTSVCSVGGQLLARTKATASKVTGACADRVGPFATPTKREVQDETEKVSK